MTKRDYILIAESIIKSLFAARQGQGRDRKVYGHMIAMTNQIVNDLCVTFKRDNPLFDIQRFRYYIDAKYADRMDL